MRMGMWSSPITASVPSVDQALRVRANRDFADRASYERFLQDLVRYRNQTRAARFAQDQQALRPLPAQPCSRVRPPLEDERGRGGGDTGEGRWRQGERMRGKQVYC